jgi:biopolymer transport protein ExbB/TolQ
MVGAATTLTLATGIGLAVAFVTYSGYRIIRKYRENVNQPYQFLSHLEKAGMSLATRPETLASS